jgi:equilibrative nucleoside transporter 1/2/3
MVLALMFKPLTSNRVMMFAGYITMMIVLVFFLCVKDPSVGLSTFLAVIVGVGDALAQSGLFAFAATTDPLYTSAVMAGNGTAGLIVGVLRLLTKWGFVDTEDALYKSSRVYFAVCVLVIAGAIFSLYTVTKKTSSSSSEDERLGDSERLRDEEEDDNDSSSSKVRPFDAILPKSSTTHNNGSLIETIVLTFNRVRRLATEAFTYLTAMFGVFLVTLALFPAIMVEIKSSSNLGDWWSVILIVIFNLFDTIGRTSLSASCVRERLESWIKGFDRKLLVLVFSRALYVPLFWLCVKPDVLAIDGLVILIVATFALSNGVLSTYIISVGSNSFKDDQDKETVSNLIVLCLMFGLAVGSVVGVGLEGLIWWV